MANEKLPQWNEKFQETEFSPKNENLAKEELEVLVLSHWEKQLCNQLSKMKWNSEWKSIWSNTRRGHYLERTESITKQIRACRSIIGCVDSVFLSWERNQLRKPVVEALCKAAEDNHLVAFVAEAFKNSFSEDGKEYYENWYETHNDIMPKGKNFWSWMTIALIEQRASDWNPGVISFNHIDKNIESKIDKEFQEIYYGTNDGAPSYNGKYVDDED